MPGEEVKNWKVYHSCMEGKKGSDEDKEYCAKVANAVASKSIKHADIPLIVRYSVEKAFEDVNTNA